MIAGREAEAFRTLTEFLDAAARNGHLNFAPGSRFLYSNTNFLLLGLIVERLARKKLGDFLAERFQSRALRLVGASAAILVSFVYLVAQDKVNALIRVLEVENPESAVIFCNTKDETQAVARYLVDAGYHVMGM